MEFIVAGHGPNPQRGGEVSEDRQQVTLGRTVSLQDIAQQNHQVRPLCIDLCDSTGQPPLTALRTEM